MKWAGRAIAWGVALGWVAALAACSQGTGASEPPKEATPSVVAPSAEVAELRAGPSARPTPSGATSAAVEANAVPDAEPFPPTAPRREVDGSTVRRIACGKAFCTAGAEACTLVSGSWQCVPSTAELPNGGFRCDDGTDCEAGKTCCASFASSSFWTACSKRRGAGSDCSGELCEVGGAPCPRGTDCVDGFCEVAQRPTCVDQKRCEKNAFCRWGKAKQCSSAAEIQALPEESQFSFEEGILACTRAADCGTQRCCTSGMGPSRTRCANECDAANNGVVCDTVADCAHLKPVYCMGDESCRMACVREPENELLLKATPPWTKVCVKAP